MIQPEHPGWQGLNADESKLFILLSFFYFVGLGWTRLEAIGKVFGGERGIRTPDTLSGTSVFKTDAINHSASSPRDANFTCFISLLQSRVK